LGSALIFANGDLNDGVMVRRALANLPDALSIAADGGARAAVFFDRQPDVVIGDMDSIEPELLDSLEINGTEILRHAVEKDETDLELALLYAARAGCTVIRVIGALGSRLDQTLSNIYLLALPGLAGRDVRLVSGAQEAWLLQAGAAAISGQPGDTVSLLPLNGPVEGVHTRGLYYPLRGETLAFGPARGVSNVLTEAEAAVTVAAGTLLIIHTAGRA